MGERSGGRAELGGGGALPFLGRATEYSLAVKKTGLKASDRFLRLHTAPAVFLNPQAGAVG